MTPHVDIEAAPPRSAAPHGWSVHFLLAQSAPWGEPKSQWKWTGNGELSADGHSLHLVGRKHRLFRFAARQAVHVRLEQVRNVVAAGRLVKFEVRLEGLEGERVEIVRLRTSDAHAAEEIAAALPKTRSAEFERAHHDKLSFDRSMELLGTQSSVTYALVAANLLWFAIVGSQGGGWLVPQPGIIIQWGSNYGPLTLNGQWWRLFSCMFVHFGLVHLAFNMWVLWSMGRLVERMFGSLHYALLYVFAGLCASLASLWWHPNINSAGASGAIFGLLGGLLAFILNPASGVPATIVASQRRSGLVFIAYNLFVGFTNHGIDNAAHLGGLVGGFLIGWILARPLEVTARDQAQPRVALAAVFGSIALAATAWHVAHLSRLPPDLAFAQSAGRSRIEFHPGEYRRVVMNSGEKVSAAMRTIHAAVDAKTLDAALADVRAMATGGDAEAAFRLGRFYHLESTAPDYASAFEFYQLASGQNHAWATNNLGLLYREGLGVSPDKDKAREYFEKAASQHNPWAYLNLADGAFGAGTADGVTKGLGWLEEGARNQCTMCLIEQAAIYHSGAHGVTRDSVKVSVLLHKASALGDAQATLIIAEMQLVGDGVPQNSRASFEMLKTLSDNGDGYASTLLGELSSDDKIRNYLFNSALGGTRQMPADLAGAVPQDTAKAIGYWERANRQGSCQSWIDLSSVYDRGIGVDADFRRAADDIEQAVHCDPVNSFYLWKLAMRYADAKGRDHDCLAAERLLKASLDHGHADAGVNLGYLYDKGCEPIARDDHRALLTYLLCAKLGVALCENNVGAMIKHGRGLDAADPARGYGWIKLAALRGDDLAKANLQDPLFTPGVRALGMAQLIDIQARLQTVPGDPQAILADPWY